MKKSIGFVSLFIAFLLSSGITIYVFDKYLNENSSNVMASVSDLEITEENTVKKPISTLCDPFCIVEKENLIEKNIFEDLDFSHRNAYAINKFHELGLIRGYEDGTFKPDANLNRVELLSVVLDSIDADFSGQILENCFKDVKTEWFAAHVCYAKNHGIVSGFPDDTFKPGNNVTRSEALKITLEAFGFDKDLISEDYVLEYLDVNPGDWVSPYLYMAQNSSVVSKNGRFGPNNAITRAEFVQLIYDVMVYRNLIQ